MAAARQDLTDTSDKLSLAISRFRTLGENATALTAGMGAWSLSEAAAKVSKAAKMAKAKAMKVVKAAEAAEAAATTATAAVTAAEKAKAAAAAQAKKTAKVAAKAAAAAAEAAQAAEVAESAAAALQEGEKGVPGAGDSGGGTRRGGRSSGAAVVSRGVMSTVTVKTEGEVISIDQDDDEAGDGDGDGDEDRARTAISAEAGSLDGEDEVAVFGVSARFEEEEEEEEEPQGVRNDKGKRKLQDSSTTPLRHHAPRAGTRELNYAESPERQPAKRQRTAASEPAAGGGTSSGGAAAGLRTEKADDQEKKRKRKEKRKEQNKDEEKENCKIYVRGLPWYTPDDDVKDFFKACGKIVSVDQPRNATGRSDGTAHVVFDGAAAAAKAVGISGREFGGRWLKIMMSSDNLNHARAGGPKVKPEGCNTVFIGNLSWYIDEVTVRETFGECGEIKSIRFAEDMVTGEFKGFGHVEFCDGAHVDAAMALANTDLMGRPVRVEYAISRSSRDDSVGGRGRGDGRNGGKGGDRSGGRGDGRSGGKGGGRSGGRGDGRSGGTSDGRSGGRHGDRSGGRADGRSGGRGGDRSGGRGDGRSGGRGGGRGGSRAAVANAPLSSRRAIANERQ